MLTRRARVCGIRSFSRLNHRQVTPKISATEAAALEAGTIGFDRDIFDGTASLQSLKDKYPMAKLDDREQAFLDNEVCERDSLWVGLMLGCHGGSGVSQLGEAGHESGAPSPQPTLRFGTQPPILPFWLLLTRNARCCCLSLLLLAVP